MCTSAAQRSEEALFNVTLTLPSSTIRNALTAGRSIEPSVSCSILTKISWTCVHCSSCVQVHLHPFKPPWTAHCTEIKTLQESELAELSLFPTFMPANRAPIIIPFVILQPSSNQDRQCFNCQCDTSVQSPVFLNLSLISGFQDQINQFFEVLFCTNLRYSWNLWICLSICLSICRLPNLPLLCQHSWTMTFCLPSPPLPLRGVTCIAVTLNMSSTVLETTISWI